MRAENPDKSPGSRNAFEPSSWYYALVFALAVLSLVTVNGGPGGDWEVGLGLHETTPILVALAILPPLLIALVREIPRGTAEIPGVGKFSWENIPEIDKKIEQKQKIQEDAGEAAKDAAKSQRDIEKIKQNAEIDLADTVAPGGLPFVQQVYLRKLDELVKEFNRKRHLRPSGKSTVAEADEIAYRMRTMAPLLFGQLDVRDWLDSRDVGKRLAAIKYLDWAQDIEFAEALADRLQELENAGDTFQTFHILLALSSMADQLAFDYGEKIRTVLENYRPEGSGATSRAHVRDRILVVLPEPRLVGRSAVFQ